MQSRNLKLFFFFNTYLILETPEIIEDFKRTFGFKGTTLILELRALPCPEARDLAPTC